MRSRFLPALAAPLGVASVVAAAPAAATWEEPGTVAAAGTEIGPDHGWRFQPGDPAGAHEPGFYDGGWQRVTLPHTWNARDGEDGGSYHRGPGWYRRVLSVPVPVASRPGVDVFNVNAERQRMLAGLDVAAEAGRNTAMDKAFPVQVTDGVLDLSSCRGSARPPSRPSTSLPRRHHDS
ncbi:MAG TPA: hypothetical protein VGX25_11195 [Actinophytocola sp.]|uniref:hypothetical protein n=1 Tax=Actinophytocola sp. TaxID=1872138 RepID=UPI002DDD9E92|nr:hypothetical protein [Actinophytocola sp.]HEV2779951.1 hypothetical protein [Actinophytocola sp.]